MSLSVQKTDSGFEVRYDDRPWGIIAAGRNPFHAGHCYLNYQIEPEADLDPGISRTIFDIIHADVNCPLQIMLDSTATDIAAFLEAGGFQRKRRCFERTFSKRDCKFPLIAKTALAEASVSSPIYSQCAELLYRQYAQKHAAINPLTADIQKFCEALPHTVLYEARNGEIVNYAFVEGNEIAYFGTTQRERYPDFIQTVAAHLLSQYPVIAFEADDCDQEAIVLKDLFADPDDDSFDTYIR